MLRLSLLIKFYVNEKEIFFPFLFFPFRWLCAAGAGKILEKWQFRALKDATKSQNLA